MEYLLCSISDQNNEGSSPRESCMKVITPRNPAARGAQLSLIFPFNINDFFVELQKRGVIVSLNIICNGRGFIGYPKGRNRDIKLVN